MRHADVVIIGGGQAGLALSHCLGRAGIDHVVLERGRIGERWRSQSWRSLRLLTPNWLNALPGSPYAGGDPDGFMDKSAFVTTLEAYVGRWQAPVECCVEVLSCRRTGNGFMLDTSAGAWSAKAVVVATGHCDRPMIPFVSRTIGGPLALHASQYRSPGELPPGGVLIVGASSSGVQIADELARAGRRVMLSVGKHTRLPRLWRGKDIFFWLCQMGLMAQPLDALANPESARRQPSLQLAGRPDKADVDLATLQALGVELTGRVRGMANREIAFADDLAANVAAAEAKQARLLAEIDRFAGAARPGRREPVAIPSAQPRRLLLTDGSIRTIIWATGYTRSLDWLEPSALGPDGELAHQGGVTSVPGLYALGFRFLRKRDSNFIGGAGTDAQAIAAEVSRYLDRKGRQAA
ncbi:NAD(P)/FAD-dependent oxidoreductase [Mesorhizobium sp. VK23B]|uniref:NAD(P)/FAD-dependent oxidoreductase n=1 Tax=Mesorhizobium dulcispinae TaxID=3072316 RepID=A0ABU4XAM0_9HYPH|nr:MULTISPECIES: NAD(P)/FAD-dependent oxidoreductase [unclassified Mesorhizobium]MDX8466026.1 NAD(P)/FAD-dependent oxidoreductase [Mesorhizobium sp. VK23B]MDX8471837.1 NAD(P)/FAD-dependent oxidoreductase [Mesorhizobium sp. VK23A]MDX8520738.1 NAD(P)/FAD-dependent oxidoreductase [Mesorhizobium sp. VK23D]